MLFFEPLLLLASVVIAASAFCKLGLGTMLDYLVTDIIIGLFLRLITDTKDIFNVPGTGRGFPEARWQRLPGGWRLIDACSSLVKGFGLALSFTMFALQIVADDGDMLRHGNRSF